MLSPSAQIVSTAIGIKFLLWLTRDGGHFDFFESHRNFVFERASLAYGAYSGKVGNSTSINVVTRNYPSEKSLV